MDMRWLPPKSCWGGPALCAAY